MRLVLALLATLLGVLTASSPAQGDRNADRAALSYGAMRHAFLDRGSGLYREVAGRPAPAHAWPYSQALSATIAMTRVPGRGRLYLGDARRTVRGLDRYLDGAGVYRAGPGASGDLYYDDNEWIALELVRWHGLRRDPRALARARRLFGLVRSAWDRDPSHPCAGGVFWTTAAGNEDRNTVTTATGALLALRLYAVTHDRSYVAWARRMLDWLDRCMLGPDGLLWDHLDLQGTVDRRHWSYNQGAAIGAGVLFYELAGDRDALATAERLADASLAYFDSTAASTEPPFFLAIFFRNLLELERVDGSSRYRAATQSYADAVWSSLRDAGTGLFRFGTGDPGRLLEQAAMVQIYALLARQPRLTAGP